MSTEYTIVRATRAIPKIDEDGNLNYDTSAFKATVVDNDRQQLSREYYGMKDLGDDHFAVCDLVCVSDNSDYHYYQNLGRGETLNVSFKWGIIRMERDENGMIIPFKETTIFPALYDKISGGNLKTAIGYSNEKLTYLDLDVNSDSYGKQLVPAVLDHATQFGIEYDGFAECSIAGAVRFLPRNCVAKRDLDSDLLFLETQVISLLQCFNGYNSVDKLDSTIRQNFLSLTGEKITREQCKTFKKTYGAKKHDLL